MARWALAFLFVVIPRLAFSAISVVTSCLDGNAVSGEFLVRVHPSTSRAIQKPRFVLNMSSRLISRFDHPADALLKIDSPPRPLLYLVKPRGQSQLDELLSAPDVKSVESNCLVRFNATQTNDPELAQNIGLPFIGAQSAWDFVHDSNLIIAVPDTGIEISHKDLSENIWINQKEFSGKVGVDDDGNGYVDDINGWSFSDKSNDVLPGSYAGADHGTHVAGIIAAQGNNGFGVSGVLWKAKIMPLRPFKKTEESATTADLVESIYYAVNNGAKIINCSWGAEQSPTLAEKDAFQYAEEAGVVVIAAAGNDSKDASLYSPASIATVYSVGSINTEHSLSTFSNFGSKVNILSPGGDSITSFGGRDESVYSTIAGDKFGHKKGTSASAPFVTGVAGMILTLLPQLKPAEVRRILSVSGDKITIRTAGTNYTYPILSAANAVEISRHVAETQPNCAENCTLSAGGSFSSSNGSFGGCSLRLGSSLGEHRASAGWDLALIFCFFFPFGRLAVKNKKTDRH